MSWATFVIFTVLLFISADIWCFRNNQLTLSSKVQEWTIKYPILPFIVGFIVGLISGHWWWPLGSIPFGG